MTSGSRQPLTIAEIRKLIVFTVVLVIAIALGFLAVWYAWRVFFLAFAALLLALILDSFTEWVERRTHLKRRPAYFVVAGGIVGICALAGYFLFPRILSEASQIISVIPSSLTQVKTFLQQQAWGSYVVAIFSRESSAILPRLTMAATSAASAIAGIVLVVVVGSYAALNPRGYISGLLRILPEGRREQASLVGGEVFYTLRWWLMGQLVPMAFLGVLTIAGLYLLGIPLAFTLGLFTALMIFIPYLGAIASAIPALLVALQSGPRSMLYVLILFLCVHSLEAYLLTPLAQKRAARLPPVITILAEFLLWIVAGPLGVIVAAPLAAAILTLIRTLYLHEPLHSETIR